VFVRFLYFDLLDRQDARDEELENLHNAVDELGSHLNAIEILRKYHVSKPMSYFLTLKDSSTSEKHVLLMQLIGAFVLQQRNQVILGLPEKYQDNNWAVFVKDLKEFWFVSETFHRMSKNVMILI
jgi:hypothetical protein